MKALLVLLVASAAWASCGDKARRLTVPITVLLNKNIPTPSSSHESTKVSEQVFEALQAAVGAGAEKLGYSEEAAQSRAFHLQFAFSEIFSNAAKWGNRFDPSKNVLVRLEATRNELILVIGDEGTRCFDPSNPTNARTEADFKDDGDFLARRNEDEDEATGGLGLTAVLGMADSYAYSFDHGSKITLHFSLEH